MMKSKYVQIALIIFVGLQSFVYAQNFTLDSTKESIEISGSFNDAAVQLPAVKKKPEFPGGQKAWQDFLRANINIKVPFEHRANPGTYKVMTRFIVGSDGKVSGIGVDSNCGYGMENEVIKCIKKSVDWLPAETSAGKKVTYILHTMVIFVVTHNDCVISFPPLYKG